MAAFFGADGPGAADVAGFSDQRVVAALALVAADGVDGREIQHVEAHLGHIGQARFHVGKGAVPAGLVARRPREQLVPAGKARPLTVHLQRQVGAGGGQAAVGVAVGQQGQRFVQRLGLEAGPVEGLGLRALAQARGPVAQHAALGICGAGSGFVDQPRTHQRGDADVVVVHPAQQLMPPGVEAIDPGLHAVAATALHLRREAGAPHVVDAVLHLRFVPGPAFGLPLQHRAQLVVTIGDDVGFHVQWLAHHALDREAAAIDHRQHRIDDGAHAAAVGRHADGLDRGHGRRLVRGGGVHRGCLLSGQERFLVRRFARPLRA